MPKHGPEQKVEKAVIRCAEARGGYAFKMNPKWYAGIPDRLVVLPHRLPKFVETKSEEGKPSKIQKHWHMLLHLIGFTVSVPVSVEAVEEMFDEWDADQPR